LEGEMRFKNRTSLEKDGEQHSIGKSVLLHLLPGFVFTLIYILGVRFTVGWGISPFFVFLIVGLLFLIPFEMGFLLYQAKKRNRSFSLMGIVLLRNKIPKWQFIILPVLLLGWAYFVAFAINPALENIVIEKFFSWVPEHYFLETLVNQIDQYSKSLLVVSAVFGIFFNGVFGPIVEELYFRGYLLSRISRLKGWAPLLNTILFSLYHFFTPWQNPLRIIALTPLYYTVWWKRNIYVGIVVHCLMNLIGSIMVLLTILRHI
jgi:membrane protease YdiL (CAAX protease family)